MEISKYDFDKAFEYENGFYLTSQTKRIGKLLSHYELYKKIIDIPGDVLELGVFKGASLIRFASFRELLENEYSRKIIGFDVWGKFSDTNFDADKKARQMFIDATKDFLTKDEFEQSFKFKEFNNIELVQGDICKTVPEYVKQNPALKISLLHIDSDIYEPAKVGLEFLWDKIIPNGIVIFDDYGTFPGETKAADDFFKDMHVKFNKLLISHNIPVYVVKE
jgi:Macrocin-O-methyltransferase (TylF).